MQPGHQNQHADLDALTAAWGSSPPEPEKIAFLALSERGRVQAIRRIKALQELTQRPERPPRDEQARVAGELGLKLKRLQGLMRDWRSDQRILVVSPEARARQSKRRSIPSREILNNVIAKTLAREPLATEPEVSRRIQRLCARLGVKPPARMTVRRALDKARPDFPPPYSYIDEMPHTPSGPPPAPGTVLILAEQYFEAAIEEPDGSLTRARARLLIDSGTGFVLGASTSNLAEIGIDAVRTLTEVSYSIGPWHRPDTLAVAASLSPDEYEAVWSNAAELDIVVIFPLVQPIRRWIRRMLYLWPIPPAPPSARGTPSHWRRLKAEELAYLVSAAVDAEREAMQRRMDFEPLEPVPMVIPGDNEGLAIAISRLFACEQEESEKR